MCVFHIYVCIYICICMGGLLLFVKRPYTVIRFIFLLEFVQGGAMQGWVVEGGRIQGEKKLQ